MLRKIFTDTGGPASRYAAVIVAAAIIACMIANAKQMPLGKRWMWQLLLGLLALGAVVMLLFAFSLLTTGVYFSAALLLTAAVALLPALYQMYQYSFRSTSIWS